MGIILMVVCLGYIVLAAIIFLIAKKMIKSKLVVVLVALVLVLFPFRRLIFYEGLFFIYSLEPLQEIHQTIYSPISVYWEDNVWPGFDEYGRTWMVKNYLDGVHLKVLALNGDDGKFYVYRASAEDFMKSEKLRIEVETLEEEHDARKAEALQLLTDKNDPFWVKSRQQRETIRILRWKKYDPQKEKEVALIMLRGEKYQAEAALPSMRYRAEFNPLPKSLLINNGFKILHADRINIVDTQSNKEIAFSQRYMAHAGFLSQISGQQPKFDYKHGDIQIYEFDDKVLFGYVSVGTGYDVERKRKLNKNLD